MLRYALGCVLVTWSAVASAQSSGAQAEILFRQGRELLAAGKTAEACDAFDASQKLEPAVTTLLNQAGCREKNGQLATAWGLFLDAERETRSASDDTGRKLHDVAKEKAAKLEPRISKLTINVPQQSAIDGLEITRDKEAVAAALWNRALPIDGGTYTITAHAPGTSTWSTQVTVGAEADTKSVDVPDMRTLPRDVQASPAVTAPAPIVVATPVTARAQPAGASSGKAVPLVVGVGAVALLGGAIGFDLWGNSTYDQAKSELSDQARRDSLYSSANTKRYVAEGLGAAGLVAAGVAVWLYLRGPDEAEPAHAVAVTPVAGDRSAGLVITGRF